MNENFALFTPCLSPGTRLESSPIPSSPVVTLGPWNKGSVAAGFELAIPCYRCEREPLPLDVSLVPAKAVTTKPPGRRKSVKRAQILATAISILQQSNLSEPPKIGEKWLKRWA
jgi:hypothetical protein